MKFLRKQHLCCELANVAKYAFLAYFFAFITAVADFFYFAVVVEMNGMIN